MNGGRFVRSCVDEAMSVGESSGISAAALMRKEFPRIRWAVPGILPEGVSLLVGKAKQGKSWMALDLCIAVASGGLALGGPRVERGEALYLALEDNQRRLARRLRALMPEGDAADALGNLSLHTEWPRIGEGGVEALDARLREHPDTRLVVIDTLAKIRPISRGNHIYQEDYKALEPLLPVAARHEVAILVVHHLNKLADAEDPFDMVSGSTGLTGGVDSVLILKRDRGAADAYLLVDGRDIEEPGEHPLKWDSAAARWWLLSGAAEEHRMSPERQAIWRALEDAPGPIGPKDIAARTGTEESNVRALLKKMNADGQVKSPAWGKYTSNIPVTSLTTYPNEVTVSVETDTA